MNYLLLLALIVTSSSLAAEPDFDWVFTGGGAKNDKTRCVNVDREGNVFLAGETTDDGLFGEHARKGLVGMDFFLAKLNPQGKALWVRSLGGSLVDRGYGVACDAQGNAYVTGHFQSTDAMINGKALPNAGDYDVFVAKYDPSGTQLWVRTAGGKGYDYGHGIAVDSHGDVVVTGAVVGAAMFGDVAFDGGSGRPIFCAKYDRDGKLLWVKGTSGKVSGSGHGIAVDGADNIYVGGLLNGEGTWGAQAVNAKTQSSVVAKLNRDGEVQWLAIEPGAPSALVHEICADAEGRVWASGMFSGTLTIGKDSFKTTGDKDKDGFVVHYDTNGKAQWARAMQGPATDYCLGVATDGKGTCFVTGEFSETAAFAGQPLTTRGATDIYSAALGEGGSLLWLAQSGGAKGDNAYTTVYHDGHLIIAGAFAAPASFGSRKIETTGGADAYAAKMKLP